MNQIEEYNTILTQINLYKQNKINVPKGLYSRQFELVTQMNDTFEKEMTEDIDVYAQGIKYNMILKYLAEKIGKPVDEYKQKIRDYAYKMTGEDVTDEEMNVVDY